MTALNDRVKQFFAHAVETKMATAEEMTDRIVEAGTRLAHALLQDNKIFVCGNGGSAANALHFAVAMLSHFEVERPPLPVIALTGEMSSLAAGSHDGYTEQGFARQIQALAQEGDMLFIVSSSGHANNLLHAVNAAHERGMDIIFLSGRDGGLLANHLGPEDMELRVSGDNAARIRELHLFIVHCFCDLIEQTLFGQVQE